MIFSVSNDTANGKVDVDSLVIEIGLSSIVPAIDSITVNADVLTINFKAALSPSEETELTAVVLAHQGVSAEPPPSKVEVANKIVTTKGTFRFQTLISQDWTEDGSDWIIEPQAGKFLEISRSEVQFCHDVKLKSRVGGPKEFYFDIWVYNPLFDPNSPVDQDSASFVPGVSQGNPLRFLYQRTVFTSIKEVFSYGNSHYTMPAAVDDIPEGITTVMFDYDQLILLKSSEGGQIRFSMQDNATMDGSFCTVSMIVREMEE